MWEGVYTALITPFNSDGSVNLEGLEQLVHKQVQACVDGIVVLGSTGEAPTLTSKEKENILKVTKKSLKPSLKMIVGTGTYSTQTTIDETKRAEELGADGVLIVTPYYNRPTQKGHILHFEAIAKQTKLPITIYNIQVRTATNLQTETLKRIAEIPNIMGVKESSGSITQMMDVLQIIKKPNFTVLSGDDIYTLPLMSIGGHGIISVLSNLLPETIIELYRACKENAWEEARKLHYQLLPLFKGIFVETNPIPIKALMEWEGLPAGTCRLPLCDLTEENAIKIRELHKALPNLRKVMYI